MLVLVCRLFFCFFLGWPWKQRLVGHSHRWEHFLPNVHCATPFMRQCLYVWVVRGYCYTDSVCLVSVRALYCIFIVSSPAASFSRYVLGLCILRPTGTERPKPTCRPSKVIAGWCYGDPTRCALPICYLTISTHYSSCALISESTLCLRKSSHL